MQALKARYLIYYEAKVNIKYEYSNFNMKIIYYLH